MERTGLVPVMAIAIVNGIFSPWVLVLFVLYPVWYPSWAPPTSQFVYMASALILSTLNTYGGRRSGRTLRTPFGAPPKCRRCVDLAWMRSASDATCIA